MPIISEGIYWFTGSVIYTLGSAVFIFYIGNLIKYHRKGLGGYWAGILTLLLFISCGFNEVLTLLVVFILGVATFVSFQQSLKVQKVVLWQFIFACLFAAILILSPGNSVRGNSYSESHRFLYSLSYSFLQVGRFTVLWVASVPLIAASSLYYFLNKKMVKECELFKYSFYLNRWASIFILFAIVFICVFPAYWATGILGQHRTLNVAYFFFLIMWFINLTVWFNCSKTSVEIKGVQKLVLTIFLVLGICFSGNGYHALIDLFSGTARAFNVQHVDRFERLSSAQDRAWNVLALDLVLAKPKCLFTYDISNNSKDWRNQAYNMYFELPKTEILTKDKANLNNEIVE